MLGTTSVVSSPTSATTSRWSPHAYFVPYKELSDSPAITHGQQVTRNHPSLPQRAGKIYVRFFREAKARQARLAQPATNRVPRSRSRVGKHNLRVRAVARPEPDLRKLALALLDVAKEMQAEEQERAA